LPEITDVGGADWSRAGQDFVGWELVTARTAEDLAAGAAVPAETVQVLTEATAADVLPAGWMIPDGTVAVSLAAVWEEADGEVDDPTDPEENGPGETDEGTDGGGSDGTEEGTDDDAAAAGEDDAAGADPG